jgi:predicted membrane channel-forming protein YqfA (hemolysin III family)
MFCWSHIWWHLLIMVADFTFFTAIAVNDRSELLLV